MEKEKNRILIIGIGNILLSDEGIGIHVLKELERNNTNSELEFLDFGTSSLDIAYYLDDTVSKIIILDSIKSEEPPGTIYKMSLDDLKAKKQKSELSLHQIGLVGSFKMNAILDEIPESMVIGIVPADITTFSTNLSPVLAKKFNGIVNKCNELIASFLLKEAK